MIQASTGPLRSNVAAPALSPPLREGGSCQHSGVDHGAELKAHDIQASMSRVGNPYDNAKAESFMKTLKQEEVDGTAYRDVAEARARIGSFIETVYNRQRLHAALDYLSPEEYERLSLICVSHMKGAVHQ